jgi:hypothetical protein
MFPIGLGLKVLFGSAILTVLTFTLLLPIFGTYAKKGVWSTVFLLFSIGFFGKAHLDSSYELGKAKSNSLLYIYNADTDKAKWVTYDKNLDSWTKSYLGENPDEATPLNTIPLFSKYNSSFKYVALAPKKQIARPTIEFLENKIVGSQRFLKIRISSNRNINRYDIFTNNNMPIYDFKANGVKAASEKNGLYKRKGKKVLSYYAVENEPLLMEFHVNSSSIIDMELLESSFDLMTNPIFKMQKRENWMMPTPFVLSDAVVIRKQIIPTPVVVVNTIIPIVTKNATLKKK